MAVKILKAVQDIARDQLSIYSVLQNLIDSESVTVSDIVDYEVTPFGSNQFIISLIYLMYQWEKPKGTIKLLVGLSRLVKHVLSKSARNIFKTVLSNNVNYTRDKTIGSSFEATKVFSLKYIRPKSVVSVFTSAAIDFLFRHYWSARTLLSIAGLTFLRNFNRYDSDITILKTLNYRAWWNGVEVEQG
jgi:hypothetical protein